MEDLSKKEVLSKKETRKRGIEMYTPDVNCGVIECERE